MSTVQNAKKKAIAAPKKPQAGGMGLESLGDLAGLLNEPQSPETGVSGPQEFSMDLIDEDPNQPRLEDNPGFRPETIAEIGATIKARGVKMPISLRENPDQPGRYLINDGARRYRGSKWAEKTTIPGFIDNDFVPDDQVVANIQREGHTAREIAKLIAQRLASGMKKGEIAKRWGKSAAYVTQHAVLLDLPSVIEDAFDSGRIADVTLVSELVTAYKKNPDEVGAWLADDSQELTRGSVKLLREFLEDKRSQQGADHDSTRVDAFTGKIDPEGGERDSVGDSKEKKGPAPDNLKKAIVQVEHDGRPARLILNRRPPAAGYAWLKYEDDGEEFEADLAKVHLVALLEG